MKNIFKIKQVCFVYFVFFVSPNQYKYFMELINDIKIPSKDERIAAKHSYDALAAIMDELQTNKPEIEIEIEETKEKLKIPLSVLRLLSKILKATSEGKPISIIPIAAEMTTQAAAEFVGCSRPHLINYLKTGILVLQKLEGTEELNLKMWLNTKDK
ncbi:MAG: excisionase [Flavobacteriaceae bacterium]|nr:excisionase [Flavobacteriaceae bacterium]